MNSTPNGGVPTQNAEQESKSKSSTPEEMPKSITISQGKDLRKLQRLIYKICRAYYPDICRIGKYFIDRTKNKYDNHVTIEGGTGSGKSMFTFILVNVMHEMLDRSFNIRKQTLFIPDEGELKKELQNLKHNDVYWLDEAIRALDKHFWYKLDQIEINQYVKTERRKCNTIFYNIQRFSELTETFRNHNIQARLLVIPRHSVVMRIRDDDHDSMDPWRIKENLSIKYLTKKGNTRYNPLMTAEDRLNRELRCIGVLNHTRFFSVEDYPTLKPLWDYYEQLKDESREIQLKKIAEGRDDKMTKWEQQNQKVILGMLKKLRASGSIKRTEWMGAYQDELPIGREKAKRLWSMSLEAKG